jgi:hypothetical protein
MPQTKEQLYKNLNLKLSAQQKGATIPGRFANEGLVDKKEQRRRDAAAGLVPFACKLPSALIAQLHEVAARPDSSVNEIVEQALLSFLKYHKNN